MIELLNSLFQSLSPLWEMSLTAAYVTAIVAVLRLILKKRAPKQVLCVLWLVVFARLLIPVSLESPLSVIPDAQQVQMVQDLPSKLVLDGQAGIGQIPPQNPVQSGEDGPASQEESPNSALAIPSGVTPAAPAPADRFDLPWQALLAAVWLAGAAAMCLYGLGSYLRLKARLFDAIRGEDGAWEHPAVASPFILGMFLPKIYLPAGLYGMPRKFILCHERAHLRRLDHIVKPICWLALALHWFNPAAWIAFILMSRDIESACDEAVIRQLGSRVKADYSATLLALATNGRVPAPCPLAFDEGDARGRIQNVLRYRRPALWIVMVSVVMAIMAAVCLLTDPVSAKEPDPVPPASAPQEPDDSSSPLDPWMEKILAGRQDFVSAERGRDVSISRLNGAYPEDAPFQEINLSKFAVVDLDRDGINELILQPSIDGDDSLERISTLGYLILRRTGDEVTSYNPSYRSFAQVKTDGTFEWGGSSVRWGWATLSFSEADFTVSRISWREDSVNDDAYFVDGLAVTRDEFDAACAVQRAKPDVTWYRFVDSQQKTASPAAFPAMSDYDRAFYDRAFYALEEFLDDEQLTAFHQAYIVYSHLFSVSSESVDPEGYDARWIEYNGAYYRPFTNEYADWDRFEAMVKSVFTDDFWNARNKDTLYVNLGGVTHYMDWARGGGGYNDNFPVTFRLVRQTDDMVFFIMTGYYSDARQYMDYPDEQINAWLAAGWEYSIDFPIRMVKTESGWRLHEIYNARTDNSIAYFYQQKVTNPDLPSIDSFPAPDLSEALVCPHGLEHVYLSTLDGTDNSAKINLSHNTSMIFRCLEDGFAYIVPAPIIGRDYWFGGSAEGDFDGDGRTEIAILQENAGLLIVCDVEDGRFITYAFDVNSCLNNFRRDFTYAWADDGETISAELSAPDQTLPTEQNQTLLARFTGTDRDVVLGYSESERKPVAYAGYSSLYASGQDIIMGLPIYLTGSMERNFESVVLLGTVQWAFRLQNGRLELVPNSFQLLAGPHVDPLASWVN